MDVDAIWQLHFWCLVIHCFQIGNDKLRSQKPHRKKHCSQNR